ncbi:MAG: DUF5996 family protein, partial [Polyangiaceae bacterium]
MTIQTSPSPVLWPELRVASWKETYATLHLSTQIVGKVRLALTPKTNQWWNVPFYLTTRGLTTSPMPYRDRTVSIAFDFIDHAVKVEDSDGRMRSFALLARPVAEFYRELFDTLAAIDVHVVINPTPVECPVTVRFPDDREHATYNAAQAHEFWQVLRRIEPIFSSFRARFRGKCSPVQFFWGSFDLAVTRFSGRRAPLRNASSIERDAYDEEVISLGFWPGDAWSPPRADGFARADAMIYSYTVPEPEGLEAASVRPDAAFYDHALREWVLPYEEVRRASDPRAMILAFA